MAVNRVPVLKRCRYKKGLIMNTKAKPFIKWVGGKGQLIEQLECAFLKS